MNRRPHNRHLRSSGLGVVALSDDDIDDILLGSLEVLERCGLRVQDDEAMDVFASAGCRVDREAHLVRIPPEVVEKAAQLAPPRAHLYGREADHDVVWECGRTTWTPFLEGVTIVDTQTGELRETTKQDAGDIARITDALSELDVTSMSVTPRDAPVETASIHGMEAALRNTTKPILIALLSRHEAETVLDMAAAVVGGREHLADKPIVACAGAPVAPLHFNKTFTDWLIPSARAGVPTIMVSQGLVGATFPVTIAGTMICGLAEELAGLVLIQACRPGCPTMLGQSTNGLDMRTGLASVGCPEMALVMATTVAVGKRLNIPSWTAGM